MQKKNLLSDNKHWSYNQGKYYNKMLHATAKFLERMKIGYTLNVCCGLDAIGDVNADLDKELIEKLKVERLDGKKYLIADVRHIKDYFKEREFDTVICDPPFSFFNKFHWLLDLSDIARKRLILSHPPMKVKLAKFSHQIYYMTIPQTLFLRLWSVYDRIKE